MSQQYLSELESIHKDATMEKEVNATGGGKVVSGDGKEDCAQGREQETAMMRGSFHLKN